MSEPNKAQEINLLLSEQNVNMWKLREMALTEGGLMNDTIRKRAWPKLVGLHSEETASDHPQQSLYDELYTLQAERKSLPEIIDDSTSLTPTNLQEFNQASKGKDKKLESLKSQSQQQRNNAVVESLDADQIQRDVARCTWHLLTGSQRSRRLQMKNKSKKRIASLLLKKQRRLADLINLTLVRSYMHHASSEERLHYYQGYHDVACIFLSALGGGGSGPLVQEEKTKTPMDTKAQAMGLDLPSRVLLQISENHLRDVMRSSFMQLQAALRLVLFPLIGVFDAQVHSFLWDCEMEPYFALSWVITWFSHDVRDTTLVKRLFDVFVASHPLFPIYMSVAMVTHPTNRADVLRADWGDFSAVHQTLVGLPKNSCSVGWKYSVGDGYISGDEEEDDTTTRSTDNMEVLSEEMGRDDGGGSQSMISSDLMHVGANTRVPFQEIIDLAITYMRRIPPCNLLRLAQRYHTQDDSLLSNTSSIALLQPPPSWALALVAPSDWILKQRARESHGMSATSRKDRKKRPSQQESNVEVLLTEESDVEVYLQEHKNSIAVIAAGFGPGDEKERRWKRQKKLLVRVSVAVVVVAIAYGVAMQYRPALEAASPQQERPKRQEQTKIKEPTKIKERTLVKNATKPASKRAPEKLTRPAAQPMTQPRRPIEVAVRPVVEKSRPQQHVVEKKDGARSKAREILLEVVLRFGSAVLKFSRAFFWDVSPFGLYQKYQQQH